MPKLKTSFSLFNAVMLAMPTFRGPDGETTTTTTTPTATPTATNPQPDPNAPNADKVVTMKQKELDALIAQERRKLQDRNTELQRELENQIKSGKLTDEQVKQAQTRIEELQREFKTKEELAQSELDKLAKKSKAEIESLTVARDAWESRFRNNLIAVELTQAAVLHGAWKPDQVVKLIRDQARIVEGVDAEGKPNGEFAVKVKVTGKRNGQPIELDLAPAEAIKMMKELPDEYGNLFKNPATGGIGLSAPTSSSGAGEVGDVSKMDLKEYAKKRQQILGGAK